MAENENLEQKYEEIKEQLDEKFGDSSFFSAITGTEEIPVETIGAMGPNVTLQEFLEEMKRHGLEVKISRKEEKSEEAEPTPQEVESVPIVPEMEDTPENREHYLKLRQKARDNLGDSGVIQAFLEKEPQEERAPVDEAALTNLNTASYQGEFSELRDLSKKLKKEDE